MRSLDDLAMLRDRHAAWGLLRYEHAPLVIALLDRLFVAPNVRSLPQPDLVEALEDDLHVSRRIRGDQAAPRRAIDYLTEWSSNERGWLRRYFPANSDEPAFDMTPAAEQAVVWATGLVERPFVGTESRLRTLFDLIERMATSTDTDPDRRVELLERRRQQLDVEIERARAGDVPIADERLLREQFQQFVSLARELLTDFRQVEHNFRALDRSVREQIAGWDGAKGSLVGEILGERDSIDRSDEGLSFRAFWEFLMSQSRQEQMTDHLERVLAYPAIAEMRPDRRVRRVHYDWLEAGEHTQRTVAMLSSQLRRFLDDTTWLEDRRIFHVLRSVEIAALAVRDQAPTGNFHEIDLPVAEVALPFERPLFEPRRQISIADLASATAGDDVDIDDLFSQTIVDVERLAAHVDDCLHERGQVTLAELCRERPIEHGLAELVAYLQLGSDRFRTVVDESITDEVTWVTEDLVRRSASLLRVVFVG